MGHMPCAWMCGFLCFHFITCAPSSSLETGFLSLSLSLSLSLFLLLALSFNLLVTVLKCLLEILWLLVDSYFLLDYLGNIFSSFSWKNTSQTTDIYRLMTMLLYLKVMYSVGRIDFLFCFQSRII